MKKSRALFGWSSSRISSHAVPAKIGHHHNRFLHWRILGLLGGCASALILGCLSPQAKGGSVSTTFDPSQTLPGAVYGTAATSSTGGDPSGTGTCLQFDTGNGQSGLLVLNELDSGQEVQSFVATFSLLMGNTNNGALHGDGFSFSFVPGPQVPTGTFSRPYLGPGSGLTIAFVTYNHQVVTNTGLSVQVTYNNQLLGYYSAPYLNTGRNFVPVTITAHPNGTVDLTYGTHTVFTNLYCFPPTQGQFCLAADSQAEIFIGDLVDLMWLENLSITTTITNNIALVSASPLGAGVPPNAPIQIQLENFTTTLNTNTLALNVNGTAVASSALSIVQTGSINTITYKPGTNFAANTTIPVVLTYQDNVNIYTNSYSFTTYPYVSVPASYAVSPSSVNKTDGNAYYIYLYESQNSGQGAVESESVAVAEQEVSGAITNYSNLSNSLNSDGGYNWTNANTINFSTVGNPGTFLGADNGSGTTTFPNGSLGSYYGAEVFTYLQLAPGTYTFGVDTVLNYSTGGGTPNEAGFKLTTGLSPRDIFAPVIASFDNSYPEGKKEFSFVVSTSGIYPFRLLNFSGPGTGALEWYMVTTNGTRVDLVTGLGATNVFGTGIITHPWTEYLPIPTPGNTFIPTTSPIQATLVDGTATTVTNSVVLTLNGTTVTPIITNFAVTNNNLTGFTIQNVTQITYNPPGGLAGGSTNRVTLAFSDSSGSKFTNSWGFSTLSGVNDPDLLVIEAEHYFTNFTTDPAVDNASSDPNFAAGGADPNTGLMVHEWVFGSDTVTQFWSINFGDYPSIVANPSAFPVNIHGYSGTGYITALPNVNYNVNITIAGDCGTAYNVYFRDAGTYYIWARGWGDASSGGGNNQNKSCNFGLDWNLQPSSPRMGGVGPNQFVPNVWTWDNLSAATSTNCAVFVATPGWHVVNFWMREDGFVLDKFLLTTNVTYSPSGIGPAENLGTPPPIILSIAKVTAGLQITWTGGAGVLEQANQVSGPYTPVSGGSSSPVTVIPNATQMFYRVAN